MARAWFQSWFMVVKPWKLYLTSTLVPYLLFLSYTFRKTLNLKYLKEISCFTLLLLIFSFYSFDKTISITSWLTTSCFIISTYLVWSSLEPWHYLHRLTVSTLLFSDIREISIIFFLDFKVRSFLIYNKFLSWIFGLIQETRISEVRINVLTLLTLVLLIYSNLYMYLFKFSLPYGLSSIVLRLAPMPFILYFLGEGRSSNV